MCDTNYVHIDYPYIHRINPNGVEGYSGKCVSVFVHMMRGDYDDFLPWPFQGQHPNYDVMKAL